MTTLSRPTAVSVTSDGGIRKPALSSAQLWKVKTPWKERPSDTGGKLALATGLKTGGDRARTLAVGWRPTSSKYEELERKATILGGIQTLQVAGVTPWTGYDLSQVPQLKLTKDKTEAPLLEIVRDGAARSGYTKEIKTLRKAAEYIRQEVANRNLSSAAWSARALHLALAASVAQEKRQKVETGVTSALSTTATALGVIGVGAPVAAVLGVIAAGTAAMGARTKIEGARSEALVNQMASDFENAVESQKLSAARTQVSRELDKARLEASAEMKSAEAQAKTIAQLIQAGVWVGLIGGTGLLVYAIVKTVRRR